MRMSSDVNWSVSVSTTLPSKTTWAGVYHDDVSRCVSSSASHIQPRKRGDACSFSIPGLCCLNFAVLIHGLCCLAFHTNMKLCFKRALPILYRFSVLNSISFHLYFPDLSHDSNFFKTFFLRFSQFNSAASLPTKACGSRRNFFFNFVMSAFLFFTEIASSGL